MITTTIITSTSENAAARAAPRSPPPLRPPPAPPPPPCPLTRFPAPHSGDPPPTHKNTPRAPQDPYQHGSHPPPQPLRRRVPLLVLRLGQPLEHLPQPPRLLPDRE